MSGRSKHLGLAVVFTGLTLFGAIRILGRMPDTLGATASPSSPNRWGNKVEVREMVVPLIFSALISIYCWHAYFTDRGSNREK